MIDEVSVSKLECMILVQYFLMIFPLGQPIRWLICLSFTSQMPISLFTMDLCVEKSWIVVKRTQFAIAVPSIAVR